MTETSSAKFKRTTYACFLTCASTAVTANLSPLLFVPFKELYGISYTLLGFLVVVNFGTQIIFDLLFSFFSHKFNLAKCVRITPVVMGVGLVAFAILPSFMPSAVYAGLVIGTILFSAGSGLAEVLISPTVAAIPSPDSGKMMSMLHSCYAWAVPVVVAASTAFLRVFGIERWQILAVILAFAPIAAAVLLNLSPIPPLSTPERASDAAGLFRNKTVIFYVVGIFLGGATECGMAQWCSSYLETAFGIDKTAGDLLGVALFGVLLGTGRTLYAKRGKNVRRTLFMCAAGACVCYVVTVIFNNAVVGLAACALTGLFASMLWPGTLIAMEEEIPDAGVALYALMASGGDIGASLCPQMIGVIADGVIASKGGVSLAAKIGLTAERFGLKAGVAVAALFPLAAAIMYFKKMKKK